MADENPIKTTVEELKGLINVKNIVGDTIETEDKILIPFMKLGLGFGAGQGNGTEGDSGYGAGAAAGIEPISIVVVDKHSKGIEGIRVLNLTEGNETSRAISELGILATDIIKELIDTYVAKQETGGDDSNNPSNEKTDEVTDVE